MNALKSGRDMIISFDVRRRLNLNPPALATGRADRNERPKTACNNSSLSFSFELVMNNDDRVKHDK